jgi:hypothetical protein
MIIRRMNNTTTNAKELPSVSPIYNTSSTRLYIIYISQGKVRLDNINDLPKKRKETSAIHLKRLVEVKYTMSGVSNKIFTLNKSEWTSAD